MKDSTKELVIKTLSVPFHKLDVSLLKDACKSVGIEFDDCCSGCIRNAYSALRTSYEHLVTGTGKARFKPAYTGYRFSKDTVVYTNANLTDEIAREILRINPGAHVVFAVLPGEVVTTEQEIETEQEQEKPRRGRKPKGE